MNLHRLADTLDAIGLTVEVPDSEPVKWAGIHPDKDEPLIWERTITFTISKKVDDDE